MGIWNCGVQKSRYIREIKRNSPSQGYEITNRCIARDVCEEGGACTSNAICGWSQAARMNAGYWTHQREAGRE